MRVRVIFAALSLFLATAQALHVEPTGGRPALRPAGAAPTWGSAHVKGGDFERLRGGAPSLKTKPGKAKVVTISTKKGAFEEWWFSHPFITRWWFVACIATTLISWERLPVNLPATMLLLDWPPILRFQFWRLLTTFTYFGSVGHNMLMECVFMLNYSKSLEVTYTGKAAHYLWHLIINSVSLMILNTFVGMLGIGMEQEDGSKIPGTPFLAQPLLYSIVWIWARQNPDTQMSVFGFTTVKAVYFPWFLLAYHCVMGGGLNIFYLMGFAVGHIFYFLQTLHPGTREWGIWNCPSFLENLLPADTASSSFGGAVKTRGEGGDEDEEDKKPKVSAFAGKGAKLGKK